MRLAGLTLLAVLALPGTALADNTIQATDGVLPDGSDNRWTPSALTIKAGETVTWSFAGTTIAHNVKSASGWDFANSPAVAGPPATYTFTTPGTYEFFCQLHATPMRGTITVTDAAGTAPPPPPPPPLSEQPFANDYAGPTTLEVRDTVAPKLDRVSLTRARKAVKVRLRLSEAGKATITLKRGKLVKRRTVEVAKGTSTVTVRGLRAGTYSVRVTAADLAGNTAGAPKRARVTIRS
jgi:plastocyanin